MMCLGRLTLKAGPRAAHSGRPVPWVSLVPSPAAANRPAHRDDHLGGGECAHRSCAKRHTAVMPRFVGERCSSHRVTLQVASPCALGEASITALVEPAVSHMAGRHLYFAWRRRLFRDSTATNPEAVGASMWRFVDRRRKLALGHRVPQRWRDPQCGDVRPLPRTPPGVASRAGKMTDCLRRVPWRLDRCPLNLPSACLGLPRAGCPS